MLGELMRVGDRVTVQIAKENREWGFNPCPDGAGAKVLGFSEIPYTRILNFGHKPGIYENRCWVQVRLEDGGAEIWLSTCHVKDYGKERRRIAGKRLRDLPETDFYEDDEVTSPYLETNGFQGQSSAFIDHIEYDNIGKKRCDGKPMPLYGLKPKASDCGGYLMVGYEGEKDLKLVARGNIWRYFHGQKPVFYSVEEEARFFARLGHTKDVRNPATGVFSFTLEEALAAIRSGKADAMEGSGGFGSSARLGVVRYKDRRLGRRVAAFVLKEFSSRPA